MNGSSARSLARNSWGGGAPEALGSQGKRKRGEGDSDSEDEVTALLTCSKCNG
jgi:hypothetical protein